MKETLNEQTSKSIAISNINPEELLFDGINCLQMKVYAISTACPPAYANIFMGILKK